MIAGEWFTVGDWQALRLSIVLASVTTLVLVIISTPLSWWLAHHRGRSKWLVEAGVSLPLVLPPTVLGFYLLILFAPQSVIGQMWAAIMGEPLAFSFTALVFASVLYSLPFVVQPLQRAFEHIGSKPLEAAWTLGASPWDAFWSVVLPMAKRGYLTAAVMGFAHTLGEFGVVLMVGGNIPGRTRVLSIAIYDHVESLDYAQAHWIAALLLLFSFLVLLLVHALQHRSWELHV